MGDFSIQISGDLVNRLINDDDKLKKKPSKTKGKMLREPTHSQTKENKKQLYDDSETRKGAPSPGWPVQPPWFVPVTPPVDSENTQLHTIKSVIQDSERILEKLQKQDDTTVREVTERAEDLRVKEFKLLYQKPMPCLSYYEALQACYKDHGNDILKCAPLTRSYNDCVCRTKQQPEYGR